MDIMDSALLYACASNDTAGLCQFVNNFEFAIFNRIEFIYFLQFFGNKIHLTVLHKLLLVT